MRNAKELRDMSNLVKSEGYVQFVTTKCFHMAKQGHIEAKIDLKDVPRHMRRDVLGSLTKLGYTARMMRKGVIYVRW